MDGVEMGRRTVASGNPGGSQRWEEVREVAGTGDGQRLIEIADSTGELQQTLFFMPTSVLPYLPGFKKFIK